MLSLTHKFIQPSLVRTWKEPVQFIHSSARIFAARKGTRERKNKKKVKVVVEKVGFIPHNLRDKDKLLANRPSRKFDDSWKRTPDLDVYCAKYYKWKIYPFAETIKCHRETHHPEMYNKPNAAVQAIIELNMQGEKKNRFVENFNRICGMPHKFHHGEERTIIAFAKDPDVVSAALNAGAHMAGGVELIKNIQNGKVSLQDFQFFIAHPDILHELASLRGVMKKQFPNPKMGTLDTNLDEVVYRYLYGINYKATKDEYEKDFGIISTDIGTLDMDATHLEENFGALVRDVMVMKPKRSEEFIQRCLIMSPPSGEVFKVDYKPYIEERSEGTESTVDQHAEEKEQQSVAL